MITDFSVELGVVRLVNTTYHYTLAYMEKDGGSKIREIAMIPFESSIELNGLSIEYVSKVVENKTGLNLKTGEYVLIGILGCERVDTTHEMLIDDFIKKSNVSWRV